MSVHTLIEHVERMVVATLEQVGDPDLEVVVDVTEAGVECGDDDGDHAGEYEKGYHIHVLVGTGVGQPRVCAYLTISAREVSHDDQGFIDAIAEMWGDLTDRLASDQTAQALLFDVEPMLGEVLRQWPTGHPGEAWPAALTTE